MTWCRRPRRSVIAEAPTRDRDLVRLHWPPELRPAFDALFAIDDAMAEVVASASQPALAAIKLAWWRESLGKLDQGPPPAEPRLREAADELLARGIKGSELASLEDGWVALVEEAPQTDRVAERGARLFAIAAKLLGAPEAPVAEHGRLWAGMDVARRTGRRVLRGTPVLIRSPKRVRPLTALSALAARDVARGMPLEPEATPGRAWALLRHRLTGR